MEINLRNQHSTLLGLPILQKKVIKIGGNWGVELGKEENGVKIGRNRGDGNWGNKLMKLKS
jgi:hypothetical protein